MATDPPPDEDADVVVTGFGAGTTCTTPAARHRPVTSRRPRRAGTARAGGEPRAACCTRGWPRRPGGPASRWPGRRRRCADHGRRAGDRGVECRSPRGAPWWARAAHRALCRLARKPYLYAPKLGRAMHRPVGWLERRYARPLRIGAERGVVIAAGGFAANRRARAVRAGTLPLATPGDDGGGIRLGTGAGGSDGAAGPGLHLAVPHPAVEGEVARTVPKASPGSPTARSRPCLECASSSGSISHSPREEHSLFLEKSSHAKMG